MEHKKMSGRSVFIYGIPKITRPGSIRLCPGPSPTDVDASLSTVTKAHWISSSAFIHMAGRNDDQDLSCSASASCFNSQEMTSSIVSSSSLNLSFLNFSYVSLSTLTCGNLAWGSPFLPGNIKDNFMSHLKTVSMSSTCLLTESD